MKGHYLHVKGVLVAALKDEYNKVIALKGKWGTGKTFLWDEIKREMYGGDNKPIYVSLFGAKTLSDLKLRILQNSFSSDKKSFNKINKAAESILSTGFSVVKHLFGISAEDTALIGLPLLVSDRLVVIDDIERKHLDLDVDELLGFLDEYSEIYRVRFLIVLNTDKLIDVEVWHTLHEKVIDFEVTLKPTPAESFDVAFEGDSWIYKEEVRSAISILGVNNIRVIERILRVVKYVHENQIDSDISAKNWVPSCALLTACYFKALDNPPSF
ncbi:MAG TPA: P-loop NTPase fold protein, partial [Cellvibrio sp.]